MICKLHCTANGCQVEYESAGKSVVRSITGARLLANIESIVRNYGDGNGLILFFLYFTVVRSVPDSQCHYGANGKHPKNVGTRLIPSTENGTPGPERLPARSLVTQLQSFKHFK